MANVVNPGRMNSMNAEQAKISANDFFIAPGTNVLSDAFSAKMVVHAGSKGAMVPREEVAEKYHSLLENNLNKRTAVYVHMPFCNTKCIYCGFAGGKATDDIVKDYVSSLIKEVEYLSSIQRVRDASVATVYFGGGTPSSVHPDELGRFMDVLRSKMKIANDCEITLEGRISDFTPENTDGFVKAGFNRFSLGVQSFNTKIRKRLGRLNSREEVTELLTGLVNKYQAAVIIDLIYGLPGQSIEDFISDLETADKIGVDGLDTYQLNAFPNSAMVKGIEAGTIPPAADLNMQGAYYKAAYDHLMDKHWRQLSVSHYAKTYRERNIYNAWAKSKGHSLGIGAGAGGNVGGYSGYRMPVVEKYIKMTAMGHFAPDVLTNPVATAELAGEVVRQIEQGYFDLRILKEQFNIGGEGLQELLANWTQAGLMEYNGSFYTLTIAGKFWCVNISQILINLILQ